jgi:hypothetical protein
MQKHISEIVAHTDNAEQSTGDSRRSNEAKNDYTKKAASVSAGVPFQKGIESGFGHHGL